MCFTHLKYSCQRVTDASFTVYEDERLEEGQQAGHAPPEKCYLETGSVHADEDADSSEEEQTQEGEADAAADSDGAEQKGNDRPMSWGRATGLAKLPSAMEWLRCCAHTPGPNIRNVAGLHLLPGSATRHMHPPLASGSSLGG